MFKIIKVRIINTFSFRKSEETHLAPLTHLAKHTILAKFSGLNLKSRSQFRLTKLTGVPEQALV